MYFEYISTGDKNILMNDISLQTHRNDLPYFINYYSYFSSNNSNPLICAYESTANSNNTYHESSVICTTDAHLSHESISKNDYHSQEKQVNWVQPSGRRRRRQRTVFSQNHIQQLDHIFMQNQYPDIDLREALAAQMGVSESRIQVWFKNRRNRARTAQRQQHQMFE